MLRLLLIVTFKVLSSVLRCCWDWKYSIVVSNYYRSIFSSNWNRKPQWRYEKLSPNPATSFRSLVSCISNHLLLTLGRFSSFILFWTLRQPHPVNQNWNIFTLINEVLYAVSCVWIYKKIFACIDLFLCKCGKCNPKNTYSCGFILM